MRMSSSVDGGDVRGAGAGGTNGAGAVSIGRLSDALQLDFKPRGRRIPAPRHLGKVYGHNALTDTES